jgi:NadR type nicotinamide-nucleotide adenylyltransferase
VPTIGHKALVEFCEALAYSNDAKAHIIVGTMNKEPIPGLMRAAAIDTLADRLPRTVVHYLNKDMPQSPEEMPEGFWELWRDAVIEMVGEVKPDDIFVASELYGIDMARVLGCRFLPFNRYRDMLDVKGTAVRGDLLGRFDNILPEFQPYLRRTVTIFGPESCGKTTMSKRLAKEMNGVFVPEWAREYLETLPTPETTIERMRDIVHGQYAIQCAAEGVHNKPWIFRDTDLLSTLGYYDILTPDRPDEDYSLCAYLFDKSKADLYIVMNDRIPFEADPLRYGGDKRESGVKFWTDLLVKHDCLYYVVYETDPDKQFEEISAVLSGYWLTMTESIRRFVR